MSSWSDRVADGVLARTGVSPNPPIDLERLAARLGVQAILRGELVEDGRLERTAESTLVTVRSDVPSTRYRFTVAHELAHILFLDNEASVIRRRAPANPNDLERLCDDIAASLLMPYEWVSRSFGTRRKNLSTIRHLAARSGCSMSAALVRLNRVASWQQTLLRWRLVDGKWRFLAGAGVPSHLHGAITTTEATRDALALAATRTRRDHWTDIPLAVHNADVVVPAHLSMRSTSALALVDLTSTPT